MLTNSRRNSSRLGRGVAFLLSVFLLMMHVPARQHVEAQGQAQIENVHRNAATVGRYEKFELTFDVADTVATNRYLPYDANPPAGLPAGTGITVKGLFSPDNWATVYTQPAFLYQAYDHTPRGDRDHLYPTGDPMWKIRFAPPTTGVWRYRIQATDGSGTTTSPEATFTVEPSGSRGFLHVSQSDPRYFEFDDGTPFVGVGHATSFDTRRPIQDARAQFANYASHRANFFRAWMTGSSIVSSAWWPWSSHHLGYDGYLPPTSLTSEEAYADGDVSIKLWGGNPCMFQGQTGQIPVLPGRRYRVRARVKTVGVSGPAQSGSSYGFVVKVGGWLGQSCSSADGGTPVTSFTHDTGGGWRTVSGSLTTDSDQYFLDNLYLTLSNATGGTVYVDQVWLQEDLGNGRYGPNLVRKSKANAHTYVEPSQAWAWDHILDEAAAHDVYLKLVILEKNEWIFNRITSSGAMTTDSSNANFYAEPETKVRWLHEAWWRYLTARWGYSTAVHSWELLNEGDPASSRHHGQAEAFARYIHAHDPNSHMVTTSNWHSFPVDDFWGHPDYSAVDYADLHAYISTGWGEYPIWGNKPSSPLVFEDDPAHVRGGSGYSLRIDGAEQTNDAGVTPSQLVIEGAGEWIIRYEMKAERFTGSCSYGIPDSLAGPRLMWRLDGGPYWGGSSNVVPPASGGQDFVCSAPAGTYGWTSFDSVHTADGNEGPLSARLILEDDLPHTLDVAVQNSFGTGGTAWIDNIEIVAPDGTVLATNGSVNLEAMHEDAALYTSAYSRLWGGASPAGAGKPLVRGEAGLDYPGGPQEEQEALAQDTEGVWLHNLVWGGINPGGMYDLYWWVGNIRQHDLYPHYEPYRDFMEDIPLTNGAYEDAEAVAFNPDLRAWGQVDPIRRRGHVWIQNKFHTWRNVVDGAHIPGLSGSVTLLGLPDGEYRVEWWDTYRGTVFRTEEARADDGLALTVPSGLTTDLAVKLFPASTPNYQFDLFLPLVVRN